MVDDLGSGHGYEGVDEYVPLGGDPSELVRDTPEVTAGTTASDTVVVNDWSPEHRALTVAVQEQTTVTLRIFNYPAWKVEVNGRAVAPETKPETGQMMVPVEAGQNRINISFLRTRDRTAGAALSAI